MRYYLLICLFFASTALAESHHYPQTLPTLYHAHQLAPHDTDILLMIARVKGWNGNYNGAMHDIDALLQQKPSLTEAYLVRGRLYYYQQHLGAAEQDFRYVLQKEPHNAEALQGLQEVARAIQQTTPPLWSFNTGYEYSSFARKKQTGWQSFYQQAGYAFNPRTAIHARMEEIRRFSQYDTYIGGGINHRLTKNFAGYASLGGSASPDFLPAWRGESGATLLLGKWEIIGDVRYADYPNASVYTLNPGIRYQIHDNIQLTGTMINVAEKSGTSSSGWLGRADIQALPSLHWYGLTAQAPETVAGETVMTDTLAAGISYIFTQNQELRVDYTHDDRDRSYIRHALNIGVRIRF